MRTVTHNAGYTKEYNRKQVLGLLRGDTDFQAVFADLGQSISKGEPVLETLGDAWNQMLGG